MSERTTSDQRVPALVTRSAEPKDGARIAEIYNQGIDERVATFETEPRTGDQIRQQLIQRGDRFPTVVVKQSEQVIAWASASPYSDRACYSGIAEFSVYTDRQFRGIGAGKAALSALITLCRAQGHWKILSRIFPENTASRSLCRSLNFREVGVYRNHARLDDVWRDVVIVERILDESVSESSQVYPP